MELSCEQLLEKYCDNTHHPDEVKRLSLMIFDGVAENLKELSGKNRRILEAASLLHDIGYSIDSKNHNKHSQKIVLDYGLKGFSQREKEIVSCICRYHRGSLPDKTEHEIYCNFDKKERKTVKRLAGILKIADGLAGASISLIKKIRINYDEENNITEFYLTSINPDFRPDIPIRKKDLFEIGFKTQVVFKFEA